MTCPTRSADSRTLRISSSKDLTLPPTLSAVCAVEDTFSDNNDACRCNSSRWGARNCKRDNEATMGSRADSSSVKELDNSASSDWKDDRHDKMSLRLVKDRGSLRVVSISDGEACKTPLGATAAHISGFSKYLSKFLSVDSREVTFWWINECM
jgi:hypothetical protein